MTLADWSFYDESGLPRVINVSGTMTGLGASIALPEVAAAMTSILPRFVGMHGLQLMASETIADLTGAEAGFITASASAGISLSLAGCMTGMDLGAVEALPDTTGLKNEVVIQLGHLCNYGAPLEQSIRLTGAKVVPVGQSTQVQDHQVTAALNAQTAAALYVVSHHVVEYGQVPLKRFAELCHAKGVPVIVDAASEYDLRGFLEDGADVVIYSGHKFLSGPTSGIVAGLSDRVRAGYLQNMGIGRGMKVGKESIYGAIAALKAWKTRDHAGIRAREDAALTLWQQAFAGFEGIEARPMPDPTSNPLDRLRVTIDAGVTGFDAFALAGAFGRNTPRIVVRDHEAELNYIALDPCNLAAGHAELVETAIKDILRQARGNGFPPADINKARNAGANGYLQWGSHD